MNNSLHIYHMNDLHSHFENWPKIMTFIKEKRALHEKNGEEMLVFDIGDHADRFHPITEASLGKANVRLMNEVGYNGVTIGNNEGITLSKQQLKDLYKDANFDVLISNLFEKDGSIPSWIKPYVIHQTNQGVNVGVIGVTVAYEKFYDLLGWDIKDAFELLPPLVKELKDKGVDMIVLLSHLGIHEDERIANELEGIDIILGAHTHHLLEKGLKIRDVTLCGTGKFGQNVGYVKVEIDSKNIVKTTAAVYPMEGVQDCKDTISQLQQEESFALVSLNKKVVSISKPLHNDWFQVSKLSSLLAEALKEWCNADIGMVNAGIFLESLQEGRVTIGDLHRICPHPINPCRVILKGDELKEVILQAATSRMEQLQMKGFGFRGKVLGRMIYDGVEYKTVTLEDGLIHVREIMIHGKPLHPNRDYSIGTIDMFTFGRLYPEISNSKEKHYYLPEMLRDVLQWKLLKNE